MRTTWPHTHSIMKSVWNCTLQVLLSIQILTLVSPVFGESSVPNIKQVGILPLYWQGQFPEGHPFRPQQKRLEQTYPELVRESRRFTFIHDVITADLWASPDGRQELAEQFEIDALVSLTITGQGDLMLWTVRLLSPSMQNYLSESERIPYSWFLASSAEDIDQRLKKLIFRTLNRYPIDVFVTSIQGRYLTLSSGRQQHVFEGDQLSFYETRLKSQHPIDGSWLEFERKALGTAKIVQSLEQSAIAIIDSLAYANAIKVGSGAKVEGIATRRVFQERPPEEQRYASVGQTPLVRPLGESPSPSKSSEASPLPPVPVSPPATPVPTAVQTAAETALPGTERAEDAGPRAQNTPLLSPNPDPENTDLGLPIDFRELTLAIEHESFSFGGATNSRSQTPAYLINRMGVTGVQDIDPSLEVRYGTDFVFGPTQKGSYAGFELGAEFLYKLEALHRSMPSLNHIMVGMLVQFESLGISNEAFGGWNAFFLSPGIHLQGALHLPDQVQTLDYLLSFRLTPFGSGSAGISSRNLNIGSGLASEFEAQVIRRGRSQEWEWGGMVNFRDGTWDLGRRNLEQTRVRFGLLGRLQL